MQHWIGSGDMEVEISSWLSARLLDQKSIKELHKTFTSSTPFPHLIIKSFLKSAQAKKLITALKKEPFEKKQSDLFSL